MGKMMSKSLSLLAVVLLVLMSASAPAEEFRTAAGGMKIKDLQKGSGPVAQAGQVATIEFIGWLDEAGARGREIFNSRNRTEPVRFVIGTDGVMPAWNEGVLGMQAGGRRMLLVPPGMAYGKRAIGEDIPANAALVFQIELVRLEDAAD